MLIYLLVFILSIFFINLADKSSNTLFRYFFCFLAIFLPAILAGLRSHSIGTDTENYLLIFESSKSYNNIGAFIKDLDNVEDGYLALNYFIQKIGATETQFLFIVHTIIHTCIVIAIFRLRKYINVGWALFIYLFMMYNESLNITRQYIAIAISLLAVSYYLTKDYKKAMLAICVAIATHTSAFVCLIFPILHIITKRYSFKRNAILLSITILFVISICVIIAFTILPSISDASVLEKVDNYLDAKGARASYSLLFTYLFLSFILILKECRFGNRIMDTFIIISLIAVGMCCLGYISQYLYRFCLYPAIVFTISIAHMLKQMSDNGILTKFSIISIVSFYWFYSYVYQGSHDTVPYISSF